MGKPLFIPLKTQYFDAFLDGSKTVEYRRYGARWNERTCEVGRRVVISKGYGKQSRREGVVVGFERRRMDSRDWIDCYGEPGEAACIMVKLDELVCCCGGWDSPPTGVEWDRSEDWCPVHGLGAEDGLGPHRPDDDDEGEDLDW